MSFELSVKVPRGLTWDALLAGVPRPLAASAREVSFEGRVPPGELFKLYHPGVSLRSVEVTLEGRWFAGGTIEVRVLSGSSVEDWRLAAAVLSAAARLGRSSVRREDGEQFSPEAIVATLDEAWASEQMQSHLRVLLDTVPRMAVVRMEGPVREHHVDVPSLETFVFRGEAHSEDWSACAARYVEWARRVQHVDAHAPTRFEARLADGTTLHFCVVSPGVATLLSDVSHVALDSETSIMIPREAFLSLVGPSAHEPLDARQVLLAPISEEAWPELLAKAAPLDVPR